MPFLFFYCLMLQWIFWVGPFIGAALAALYHQVVIRAIPFKSKWWWVVLGVDQGASKTYSLSFVPLLSVCLWYNVMSVAFHLLFIYQERGDAVKCVNDFLHLWNPLKVKPLESLFARSDHQLRAVIVNGSGNFLGLEIMC